MAAMQGEEVELGLGWWLGNVGTDLVNKYRSSLVSSADT